MRLTTQQKRGIAILAFIPILALSGAVFAMALVERLSPYEKLQKHIRQKQQYLRLKRKGLLPKRQGPGKGAHA